MEKPSMNKLQLLSAVSKSHMIGEKYSKSVPIGTTFNFLQKLILMWGLMGFLSMGSVHASTVAFDFTGGSSFGGPTITLGYSFTVNSAQINVTDLGFLDTNLDGLASNHLIGIWDTSQNLLASATIAAGTAAPLIGNFRYVSLASPLSLTAGQYIIGAQMNGESYVQDATINNLSPSVTFGNAQRATSVGFIYPNFVDVTDNAGYFGPNLQFNAVPIPAAVWLFGSGLIGLIGIARRKKS